MPDYKVNSDRTGETSSQLQSDFGQLQDKLTEVKGKVSNLLADGYDTPRAKSDFQPFFDEFTKGFDQVNQGLDGISKYVKSVGDTFDGADQSTGQQLSGQS